MSKQRIKVTALPEFDAAPYLDSEEAIAAYLTDILQANDAGLLAAALGDIARARGMTEIAKSAGITGKLYTRHCGLAASRASIRSTASAPRSACAWSPSPCMPDSD